MSVWRLRLFAVDDDGLRQLVHICDCMTLEDACRAQLEFVCEGGMPSQWWHTDIKEERIWT